MESPNHCQSSTSIEASRSTHLKPASYNVQMMDASKLEPAKDVEQLDTNQNSPQKLEADEGSRPLEDGARASSVDAADDMKSSLGPGSHAHGDTITKDGDPCNKADALDDARSVETDGTGTKDVCMIDGAIGEVEEHSSAQSLDHHLDLYGVKDYDDRETSNVEVDFMVDPIEVALQVAIAVEREVGDRSREQSCSSSGKVPENGSQHVDSPDSSHETESRLQKDSSHETESQLQKELSEEVPSGMDLSVEDQATSPESLDPEEPKKETLESSQLTYLAQGVPDLNEIIVSSEDEEDYPENPTIVSASRATAAPVLPNAPLQFEGSLGWKGSAATSAFRPALHCRTPEGDKVHSIGGSNSSSRQRDGWFDIDLNVYDETLEKQVRSCELPSGESSVEVSTRVLGRAEFDLNRGTDDSDAPIELQTEKNLQPRNGYVGLSLSSSSSEQHSVRDIDLNDPSSGSESPGMNFSTLGVKKSDENFISIMGMKIQVRPKDLIPQSHPLLNGRIPDAAAVDLNLSRSGGILGIGSTTVAYSHSHSHPHSHSHSVYGYNGLAALGPGVALSSGVNIPLGPIPPYMMDSRVAPVIHQVMGGSTPVLATAIPHPSPFMMSIPGSDGGVGPPRKSFDLNAGVSHEDLGNRESGGGGGGVVLRQFFNTGQSRPNNDQLRSSSSGVGAKRKEPESGWELFAVGPRPSPPPTWK